MVKLGLYVLGQVKKFSLDSMTLVGQGTEFLLQEDDLRLVHVLLGHQAIDGVTLLLHFNLK